MAASGWICQQSSCIPMMSNLVFHWGPAKFCSLSYKWTGLGHLIYLHTEGLLARDFITLPIFVAGMAEFRKPLVADEAVMSTNDEAACSKKHAVSLNYWKDPYINLVCRQTVQRKTPEISRGYFARVFAVRSLVEQFIKVCLSNIMEWIVRMI